MKALDFIQLRDEKGRASSLGIYGRRDTPPMLLVVGNLEHSARVEPDSVADADKLIAWLKEWKARKEKEGR